MYSGKECQFTMAWPVRHLPVLQHWDCQGCTSCCREYQIQVSPEERRRLLQQDWQQEKDLAGLPLVLRAGSWWKPLYRLQHRDDGRCVFVSDQGRCRIHERFGRQAKPIACQLYPFILVPAGDHWRVGLRFACPAAVRNQGKLIRDHEEELRRYGGELERLKDLGEKRPLPPPLEGRHHVPWPDLLRFIEALLAILQDRRDRMERRWRKCLALAGLCRQARFNKLSGERVTEFLDLASASVEAEVPVDPAALPPPSGIGRLLFRQSLAAYARKDQGPDQGPDTRSRLRLLHAAWRFARGRGSVPALHAALGPTTFEELEEHADVFSEEAEELLERYYLVKVGSLQFCGPANFGLSFWDGLEGLALTLPAIAWLGRAFRQGPREAAVAAALATVDYNFGYNPHLGGRWRRLAARILSQRGELARLLGWYGR